MEGALVDGTAITSDNDGRSGGLAATVVAGNCDNSDEVTL